MQPSRMRPSEGLHHSLRTLHSRHQRSVVLVTTTPDHRVGNHYPQRDGHVASPRRGNQTFVDRCRCTVGPVGGRVTGTRSPPSFCVGCAGRSHRLQQLAHSCAEVPIRSRLRRGRTGLRAERAPGMVRRDGRSDGATGWCNHTVRLCDTPVSGRPLTGGCCTRRSRAPSPG